MRTEDGHEVAWVAVNKDSSVSFMNIHGHALSCALDNGLQIGSQCTFNEEKNKIPVPIPQSDMLSDLGKFDHFAEELSFSGIQYATAVSSSVSSNAQSTSSTVFSQNIGYSSLASRPLTFTTTAGAAFPARLKPRHIHRHHINRLRPFV